MCLEKPISRSALFDALAKVLGVQGQTTRVDSAWVIPPTPARKLHVLLAEDTPANQKLVLHVLGKRGHGVEVAPNGREALELFQRQDFDAVLMDVQMPEMDGLAATAAIRKLDDPKKARVPVIAMTAYALKGDRERCLAAGMDSYISKPINGNEMIEMVERVTRAAVDGLLDPAVEARVAPSWTAAARSEMDGAGRRHCLLEDPGLFDMEDAVGKCYGNRNMFQEMVGCFFDEADALLTKLRAVLDRGEASVLADTAHRLRGTIVYLGARPASESARRVEQIGRSGELAVAGEAMESLAKEIQRLKEALAPHRPV